MFLVATVVMCMSFTGAPEPPWAKCEVIESPLVPFTTAADMGRDCRLALQDNLRRWIAAHNARGWVKGLNCQPVMPRQMG